MAKIRRRRAAHAADYEIAEPLYADTPSNGRWRPGDKQAAHADARSPTVVRTVPLAAFASIIY